MKVFAITNTLLVVASLPAATHAGAYRHTLTHAHAHAHTVPLAFRFKPLRFALRKLRPSAWRRKDEEERKKGAAPIHAPPTPDTHAATHTSTPIDTQTHAHTQTIAGTYTPAQRIAESAHSDAVYVEDPFDVQVTARDSIPHRPTDTIDINELGFLTHRLAELEDKYTRAQKWAKDEAANSAWLRSLMNEAQANEATARREMSQMQAKLEKAMEHLNTHKRHEDSLHTQLAEYKKRDDKNRDIELYFRGQLELARRDEAELREEIEALKRRVSYQEAEGREKAMDILTRAMREVEGGKKDKTGVVVSDDGDTHAHTHADAHADTDTPKRVQEKESGDVWLIDTPGGHADTHAHAHMRVGAIGGGGAYAVGVGERSRVMRMLTAAVFVVAVGMRVLRSVGAKTMIVTSRLRW